MSGSVTARKASVPRQYGSMGPVTSAQVVPRQTRQKRAHATVGATADTATAVTTWNATGRPQRRRVTGTRLAEAKISGVSAAHIRSVPREPRGRLRRPETESGVGRHVKGPPGREPQGQREASAEPGRGPQPDPSATVARSSRRHPLRPNREAPSRSRSFLRRRLTGSVRPLASRTSYSRPNACRISLTRARFTMADTWMRRNCDGSSRSSRCLRLSR